MGIYRWIMESLLGPLASTADIQRFSEWKNKLEEALKELESEYKKKNISKNKYQEEKAILQEKLEKANELLEKSRQRLDEFTNKEVRL